MTAVAWTELSLAFDWVSSGPPMQDQAFIDRKTGAIHWVSEDDPLDDEDAPEDLDDPDRYVEIPHRHDLDLGRRLALRFVARELPDLYDEVDFFLRRRGGWRRFKDLLARRGFLERWFAHEAECEERALREWCSEVGIEILPPETPPA